MATLILNMTNFTTTVNEAHKFQREEHKEQINALKDIPLVLKEITTTLGRINGYTHEGPRGEKGERGKQGEQGEHG